MTFEEFNIAALATACSEWSVYSPPCIQPFWFHIPNLATEPYTSDIPENDAGNVYGPLVSLSLPLSYVFIYISIHVYIYRETCICISAKVTTNRST